MRKQIIAFILVLSTLLVNKILISELTINTNFDWEYYAKTNNLRFFKEQQAVNHYLRRGYSQNLEYCQKFNIAILLHLYNLDLADEFIEKINYFIKINNLNDFIIKVNIPIGNNIDQAPANKFLIPSTNPINNKLMLNQILAATPYHKSLITDKNFSKLAGITNYITNKIELPIEKIQIIFSENRGLDIGGFFLLMDQLVLQNKKVDYIVKLHSKSNCISGWRQILTSMLNLRINKLLRAKEYVHPLPHYFNWNEADHNTVNLRTLLGYYNLPKKNFYFAAGTMFIASSKIIDFFKEYSFLELFNSLNKFTTKPDDGYIEHAYERFFGYLCEQHLNLKLHIIDQIYRTNDELLLT